MGKGRDRRKKLTERNIRLDKIKSEQREKLQKDRTEERGEREEKKKVKKKNNQMKYPDLYDSEDDIEILLAELTKKAKEKKVEVCVDEKVDAPTPRLNSTFIASPSRDGDLILFGGEHYNGDKTNSYNDLYVYSIDKGTWKTVESPNTPPPRSSHQAVVHSKFMYIWGGEFTSPSQNQFYHYRDLWRLDCDTMKWEELKPKGGPTARSGHRMVLWKSSIIMFGGFFDTLAARETKYSNDLWQLTDLSTAIKWKSIPYRIGSDVPSKRSGCCIGCFGDNIYIHGGYSCEGQHGFSNGITHNDTWSFNMNANVWRQVKKVGIPPSVRSSMAAVIDRGRRMVFFGGVMDLDDRGDFKSVFYNDMYCFNMENERWFPLILHGKKKSTGTRRKRRAKQAQGAPGPAAEEEQGESSGEDEETLAGDDPSSPSTALTESTPAESVIEEPEILYPSGRINTNLIAINHWLYLYGGMHEEGNKEVNNNDMYKINLQTLDTWECVFDNTVEEWITDDEDEDEGRKGKNRDDDDDDDDDEESEESEEEDEEAPKGEEATSSAQPAEGASEVPNESNWDGEDEEGEEDCDKAVKRIQEKLVAFRSGRGRRKTTREKLLAKLDQLCEGVPPPEIREQLKDYFRRTVAFWTQEAGEISEEVGKSLRKDGFNLCQIRYGIVKPVLEKLEEIEAKERQEKEMEALLEAKKKQQQATNNSLSQQQRDLIALKRATRSH